MPRPTPYLVAALVLASTLVAACSSKTGDTGSSGAPALTTSTAAAVTGPTDTHCAGQPVVVVDPAVCHAAPDPDAGGADLDGGATGAPEFGATLFNSEGDDDDCKYHVKWQSTTVAQNKDVTLAMSATTLSDGKALAGAKPYAEIFLDDKHPAPNTPVQTTETAPGSYTIGPVQLNAPGQWTVRFHFFADCNDSPTSQHGHAAFFVKVP